MSAPTDYAGRVPEGDTIWRIARELRAALADTVITTFDLRVPRYATADARGAHITGVRSRGKHLLIDLDRSGRALVLHTTLGMDGAWRVFTAGERWRGGPAFQIRAVIGNAEQVAVGYLLPNVDLLAASAEASVVGHLGPDLLGPDWDPVRAISLLLQQPQRPLAEALLDQRNLAGIGNVFKSELCFLQRLHPVTPVGQVPDLLPLVEQAHELLILNAPRTKRMTTGHERRPLWVYHRGGQPCRRCGTVIEAAELGESGRERWTWWCPTCQPAPDRL